MACLHPIQIVKKDGTYMKVPCGKCAACLNAKALNYTMQCRLENLKHKYCYFITLTYDNDKIPLSTMHESVYDEQGNVQEYAFTLDTERLKKYYKGSVIDDYTLKYNLYYV